MNNNAEKIISAIIILLFIALAVSLGGPMTALFIEPSVSRPSIQQYYWTYRGLDILVQAFLVFAAAAAVAGLFREEIGIKGGEEEEASSEG